MNVNPAEVAKFDALAARWWDPEGDFRPLHDINPARLNYISERADLTAGPVLDIGCGGGILSEAMATAGAQVTGIDLAEKPLAVARLHAMETGVQVDYRECSAETLAAERPGTYRTVTCLEMLEHVPDYASTVQAAATLCAAGGDLVFSTINRTPKAYVMAILGAEYVMKLLPRGTHDWAQFIRPAELAAAVRAAGLTVVDIAGMQYNPFSRSCTIDRDPSVNYLLHARKT